MIRSLALTASLLLAGAAPALAQAHAPSHVRSHSHDQSGHVPLDPAQHAAMHALLLGSWQGTFKSAQGVSSGMDLSVAHDSVRTLTLKMTTDRPLRAGAASNFVMNGDNLYWTQDLSGTSCKVTAVLSAATTLVPEMMTGSMACEDGEVTFTLRKATG